MRNLFIIVLLVIVSFRPVAAQNIGIGTINPVHSPLEIQGAVGKTVALFGADRNGVGMGMNPPFVGFNFIRNSGDQVIKAGYAALIWMDTLNGDLHFGNFSNTAAAADFGAINNYQTWLLVKQNGNVGIGAQVNNPAFPLTVSVGSYGMAMQESPDATGRAGFFVNSLLESGVTSGAGTALNFATGNGVSRMVLQTDGVLQVNENMTITEKLTSTRTGTINLLPIAMGKIAADGTVLSATPGVSVIRGAAGQYSISFSFEPNLYANRDKYSVQLTTEGNVNATSANYIFRNDNTLFVKTWIPQVNYITLACNCGGGNPSSLSGSVTAYTDCVFSFMVRKME